MMETCCAVQRLYSIFDARQKYDAIFFGWEREKKKYITIRREFQLVLVRFEVLDNSFDWNRVNKLYL